MTKEFKIKPLAERVVLQAVETEETTKSGIVLPDTAQEKPTEGIVLAVGPGRIGEDGKRIALDVKSRRPSNLFQIRRY